MRLVFNGTSVKQDYLGSGLIFLNVILLSIWAIKDTIALRNILLVLGAITSIIYIANGLALRRSKEAAAVSPCFASDLCWIDFHLGVNSLLLFFTRPNQSVSGVKEHVVASSFRLDSGLGYGFSHFAQAHAD
jgi:hypothetical protein